MTTTTEACATCGHRDHARWCGEYRGKRPICRTCSQSPLSHAKWCPERVIQPKPNPCRCSSHEGKRKVAYGNEESALRAAIGLSRGLGYGRVYQCPTSTYWHTTTLLSQRRRSP